MLENLNVKLPPFFRKIAREIIEKKIKKKSVKPTDVSKYLGPYKYSSQIIEEKDTVGISTGLAWTQAGGDILFIEVAIMPGKGNLTLTGHLGDVMKESCQAALSYVRPRWKRFKIKKSFSVILIFMFMSQREQFQKMDLQEDLQLLQLWFLL